MAEPPQSLLDIREPLEAPVDHEADLRHAVEMGNPSLLARVLSALVSKHGINRLSRETGLRRKTLYRITVHGDPRLSTLIAMLRALGYGLTIRERVEERCEIEQT